MIHDIFTHIKTHIEYSQLHFDEIHTLVHISENFILLKILYIDMKKKIIDDRLLVFLLIVSFLYSYFLGLSYYYILGLCTYHIPLLILYIVEDFFGKPLIGFGDIKLMMVIGGIFNTFIFFENDIYLMNFYTIFNKNWNSIITFYKTTYLISGIFCVFYIFKIKNIKNKIINTNKTLDYNKIYIAFSPFLIISFWILVYIFKI